MWRMPMMNLSFVLVLITLVSLQQSAALFSFTDTVHRSTSSEAMSGIHTTNTPLAAGMGTTLNFLSKLWHRSMILKNWFLESQAVSWDRFRAAPGAGADLVEARWHVANAEVFGTTMGERQKAKNELDRADGYLLRALPAMDSDLLFVVNAIRTEITDAKIELDIGYPDSNINDEQIKTDLDWLIQTLEG